MLIDPRTDLHAYFAERLSQAMRTVAIRPTEAARHYLVDLLATRAVAPSAPPEMGLMVELTTAIGVRDPEKRLVCLRRTGDDALWCSGVLADHCELRGISQSYVAEIGFRAYRRAERLARGRTGGAKVLAELADEFRAFARLIGELHEHTALRAPQDVVRLYDRYRRLRSPTVALRLGELGVFPQKPSGTTH